MITELLAEQKSKMKKTIDNTAREMSVIRTGKATPAILDNIRVECWGGQHPLKQVAGVSAPEPSLLVIQPFDPSTSSAIVKAIETSSIGLRASADGTVIRIPIPKLSQERRTELARQVKKLAEMGKTSVRNIRRIGNDILHKAAKNSEITEDQEKKALDDIQKLADDAVKKIDEILKSKENDIMEV